MYICTFVHLFVHYNGFSHERVLFALSAYYALLLNGYIFSEMVWVPIANIIENQVGEV